MSTKLIQPRCQGELVHRQRLFDKLGKDLCSLTTVCAPAGFGKTTLLTAWLEAQEYPVAWLSLDEDDNDPARFFRYLIASIQCVHSDFGHKQAEVLSLPQSPNIVLLIRSLVNEMSSLKKQFIVALDDFHVIENSQIHEAIQILLDHLPINVYMALTSRTEPSLRLPRLRVRRQLTEISETDLRFNNQETTLFLNQVTKLDLSDKDIGILEARTEGWIAGLQLAAISLEQEQNRESFIKAFAGDDRYIMDYLTEEVLKRQSDSTHQFLLQTSVLTRLNGPLCDKLTQRRDSAGVLEQLERSNMFVIPLDHKRHWYRYHHLFAELLREQLSRSHPEQLHELHHGASEWFNENGYPNEAIQHALKVDDFEQAARVLDQHGQYQFEQGQTAMLSRWHECLPESVILEDPIRTLKCIWIHFLVYGEILHRYVTHLQSLLDDANQFDLTEEQLLILNVDLALMDGFRAMQQRKISQAKDHAERSLKYCQDAGIAAAVPPRLLLASASLAQGHLNDAESQFAKIIEQSFNSNYLLTLCAAICGQNCVLTQQGRLRAAEKLLNQNFNRLKEMGWDQYLTDTAWIHLSLAELAYRRNKLVQCIQHVDAAKAMVNREPCDILSAMIEISYAKVYRAQGDKHKTDACLSRLKNLNIEPPILPFMLSIEDALFEFQLGQGNLSNLDQWLERTDAHIRSEFVPEQEWQNIIYVRVLLKQHQVKQAISRIIPLLLEAEKGKRQTSVIELLVLQALARQTQGQIHHAIESLNRALVTAAPEKYVRIFLDEGAPMVGLLKHVLKGPQADFALYLLQQAGDMVKQDSATLPEALSAKEQQTMELLIAGLSNKEIAEKLFVSPNTVKTHLKNIYKKLNVKNRVDAVSKGSRILNQY